MPMRTLLRAVLAAGLLLALTVPAGAAQERSRRVETIPLVTVEFADDAELVRLLEAGLDIHEVDHDSNKAFVVLHAFDRRYLTSRRIPYEVVEDDVNLFHDDEGDDDVGALGHGQRTSYRHLSDYDSEMQQIAQSYPGIARLQRIGTSIQNRPIRALEISSAPGVDDGRPEHVHMALHHAREWPSGELAMDLAWHLVEGYGSDPRVTGILDSTRVFVIPVVNPDGFHYSRTTYPMWRKNRNPSGAVDLNRNYSYYWGGPGSSNNSGSQTYRGTAPFSEPEAAAIRDFLLGRQAVTLITGHTHGGYWLHSWGHKGNTPPDSALGILAAQSVQVSGYNDGQTSHVLYTASGDTTDWGYGAMRQLGFTPEYVTSGSFHPSYQGSATPYPYVVTDKRLPEGRTMQGSVAVSGQQGRLVNCGRALSPSDCPSGTQGAIALIERGGETFANKALNAAQAGAVGAVIYNDTSGHINGTLGGTSVPIPVFGILRTDGLALLSHMAQRNLDATLSQLRSDSMAYLWVQQLPALLHNIEAAHTYAAHVTGNVRDASTGRPVTANMTLSLTRRSFDAFNRWFNHAHTTSMTATGAFDWAVLPSRQPELTTPSYTLTISAPGYQSQQRSVTLNGYGSQASLGNVNLQPQGALSLDSEAEPAMSGTGN